MSEEIVYIKRGRRYKPIRYYDPIVMDSLPIGSHLIVVTPGMTSYRYNVEPDHAPLMAAFAAHRDVILEAIRKACEMKPNKRAMTPIQAKGWEAYCKVAGSDSTLYLDGPSHMDICDALEKSLIEKCKEMGDATT